MNFVACLPQNQQTVSFMTVRLGSKIRGRRGELRISQETLAERIGLHRNTIYQIERDADTAADVPLVQLVAIAWALDLDPEELGVEAPWRKQAQQAPAHPGTPLLKMTGKPLEPPPGKK